MSGISKTPKDYILDKTMVLETTRFVASSSFENQSTL